MLAKVVLPSSATRGQKGERVWEKKLQKKPILEELIHEILD